VITIGPGTTADVRYVVEHLREMDRIEMEATSPTMDPGDITRHIMLGSQMVFVAYHDDVPVSCWGLMPMWQGVGFAYCFGTDDWGSVLLPMTRHVKRFMLPLLLDNGFHRIETRSLAVRTDVGRWLEAFGAEAEAVMRGSGARGEDFILYRWLRDEHRPAKKNPTGDHHSHGDDRRRRRAYDARNDAAARVADVPPTVQLQPGSRVEVSARRHWERSLSAHRGDT
jgi:hypothetical protein